MVALVEEMVEEMVLGIFDCDGGDGGDGGDGETEIE